MACVQQRIDTAHWLNRIMRCSGGLAAPRFNCVFDQQNRVFSRYAHQHDQPDQRRHRKAFTANQQRSKRTAKRQRKRRQNSERVQKVFEQQHQHDVNTQHRCQHGQGKTGKQFAHHFGISNNHLLDACWQIFKRRQIIDGFGHVAQRQTRQFDFKLHIARAVKPVYHRGATGQLNGGNLAEHDRTPGAGAGHHQALQRGQVFTRVIRQAHHDRHLALRQVEFGQRRIEITDCGNAHRFANRGAGHTQVSHAGKVGAHRQFRAHQRCARRYRAQASNGAQFFFQRSGGCAECDRVFTGQRQHKLFTRTAQADFAAHAGQVFKRFANVVFNALLARPFAALGQQNGQRGLARFSRTAGRKRVTTSCASAHRGVHRLHMRNLADQQPSGFGSSLGLCQPGAGRQLQIDLRLRVVVRRNEARGQQRNQKERADKENASCHHRDPAVLQTPAAGAHVPGHQFAVLRVVLFGQRLQNISRHHGGKHARNYQ